MTTLLIAIACLLFFGFVGAFATIIFSFLRIHQAEREIEHANKKKEKPHYVFF